MSAFPVNLQDELTRCGFVTSSGVNVFNPAHAARSRISQRISEYPEGSAEQEVCHSYLRVVEKLLEQPQENVGSLSRAVTMLAESLDIWLNKGRPSIRKTRR